MSNYILAVPPLELNFLAPTYFLRIFYQLFSGITLVPYSSYKVLINLDYCDNLFRPR